LIQQRYTPQGESKMILEAAVAGLVPTVFMGLFAKGGEYLGGKADAAVQRRNQNSSITETTPNGSRPAGIFGMSQAK